MAESSAQRGGFYDLKPVAISGEERSLAEFQGKVALVVNTASACGFTDQYRGLEELFQKYRDQGFVVLGFPSNDFGGQEPGANAEIEKFCELNYGVTFPLFEKGSVKGANKQEVYRFLTAGNNGEFAGDPGWNFVKFLIDCHGQIVGRFSSMTKPSSKKLLAQIEELLKKRGECASS